MKRDPLYYDTHNAKIYKDLYRPSVSIGRFVKTLLSIIVMGNSPISRHNNYPRK